MPRHTDNTWLERMSGYLKGISGTKSGSANNNADVVNTGGIYRSVTETFADGSTVVNHYDGNGNLLVSLGRELWGENSDYDRIMTLPLYSGAKLTADTLLKTGAGVLHTLTFAPNDATPTAGTIILFDSTTEAGTELFNWNVQATAFIPFTVILDVSFTNGCYLGFTTTNDVNVTPSYI